MSNMLETRRKLFWVFVSCISISFAVYVFMIQTTIFYRISSDSWLGKSTNLDISTVVLEARYYELSKNISTKVAYQLGFENAGPARYVRKDPSLSILQHDRERQRY